MTGFITLPLPTQGRVQLHIGCLGIPVIFQLVCHAFLSIKFVFSSYSRSVEARNCCSDRRETRTQIGLIGKTVNCIGYQIQKPVSVFLRKPKTNCQKTKNLQTTMNIKTEKPKSCGKKPKNQSKKKPKPQNPKSQCPPHKEKLI